MWDGVANDDTESNHAAERAVVGRFSNSTLFWKGHTYNAHCATCFKRKLLYCIERSILTEMAIKPDLPKQCCTVAWKEFAPLSLEFVTMRRIVQST